jgi:hypothetical protein
LLVLVEQVEKAFMAAAAVAAKLPYISRHI